MLLDRSGQGKVYQLISRRRFQQMEVLEGQNILVTISGKKNRVRVYYLSWLKSKILRTDGVSDVGDHNAFIMFVLQYCMNFSYKDHTLCLEKWIVQETVSSEASKIIYTNYLFIFVFRNQLICSLLITLSTNEVIQCWMGR